MIVEMIVAFKASSVARSANRARDFPDGTDRIAELVSLEWEACMKFLLTALCSLALTLAAFVVGAASSVGQPAPSVEAKIKLPPGLAAGVQRPDAGN